MNVFRDNFEIYRETVISQNMALELMQQRTRMHSSRMRTGRSLTVCCSLRGGGVSAPRGVSALGGGGVCSWGCLVPGGSAPGGCIPACTEADTLPPMDRILDTRL